MNNFLYAMTEFFKRINHGIHKILSATTYEDKEKREILLCVGTRLHWILVYAERIVILEQDKEIVSAFRYANNTLTHNSEVKEITEEVGGFEFPIEFLIECPGREVVWAIIDNGDKKNHKRNYKTFLEGKDVIETCEKMIGILREYKI